MLALHSALKPHALIPPLKRLCSMLCLRMNFAMATALSEYQNSLHGAYSSLHPSSISLFLYLSSLHAMTSTKRACDCVSCRLHRKRCTRDHFERSTEQKNICICWQPCRSPDIRGRRHHREAAALWCAVSALAETRSAARGWYDAYRIGGHAGGSCTGEDGTSLASLFGPTRTGLRHLRFFPRNGFAAVADRCCSYYPISMYICYY